MFYFIWKQVNDYRFKKQSLLKKFKKYVNINLITKQINPESFLRALLVFDALFYNKTESVISRFKKNFKTNWIYERKQLKDAIVCSCLKAIVRRQKSSTAAQQIINMHKTQLKSI